MTVNRFPVEGGHVLTFARAIGDTNAAYSARIDDVRMVGESGGRELDITLTTRNQRDEVVLAGTAKVRLESDE